MWKARCAPIGGMQGDAIAIAIAAGARALSVGEVIAGWRGDEAFRAFFITEMAATAFPAFFWEMPPVARTALSNPFECVVIRGDALAHMRADETDFASHLNSVGTATVVAFRNLGRDALLLAPRRMSDANCYGHVAAFLRVAPVIQQHQLFQMLAREADALLDATRDRLWISTSGLGVPWVHVRLDSYPKYYQYRRYADAR